MGSGINSLYFINLYNDSFNRFRMNTIINHNNDKYTVLNWMKSADIKDVM